MIAKTALLTAAAGLMFAAPAFAQDATSPSAPAQTTPAPAAAPATTPAPAQPGTLQLQPGSDVKGSDGAVLGKLEGVRNNAAGEQELTVRGSDGQLRGVPLGGLKPEGTGVSVAWTSAEFQAAPAISGAAPAATPAPAASSAATPPVSEPASEPAEDETEAAPPATEPQA